MWVTLFEPRDPLNAGPEGIRPEGEERDEKKKSEKTFQLCFFWYSCQWGGVGLPLDKKNQRAKIDK